MSADDLNRIAIAQMNACVGAIDNNVRRIIDNIRTARQRQADMIIFPELAISGYPPEDLLLRPDFHRQVASAVEAITAQTQGITLILGHSESVQGKLYNVCSLIQDGRRIHSYHKRCLPNYGVFDEKRYFTPGTNSSLCHVGGRKIALSICEDLWTDGPAAEAAGQGAQLLININASPYHTDKARQRQQLICQRASENALPIIYVNMVGGQDELVFDGDSMSANAAGEIVFRAPRFVDDLFLLEATTDAPVALTGNSIAQPHDDAAAVYQAIVLGVKDYAAKNHFAGAVIGLSGGIDSALTLAIAVDALGAENVEVLLMPSRYTAEMSNTDAEQMATALGVTFHRYSIEAPFAAFLDLLQPAFKGRQADATEENIQARCRGILLMAISNKSGKLVLTTGNKSEMAVGYATLYGDMAGGFAPLKDISKTRVYELANWRNRQSPVIPPRMIDRPPSAELRPGQKDTDSLPAYEILDAVLERYIERDNSPTEIIAAGFDAAVVSKISRLVDRNEYKRRQAAPGVRITARAFGRDRRYPISSDYQEKPPPAEAGDGSGDGQGSEGQGSEGKSSANGR